MTSSGPDNQAAAVLLAEDEPGIRYTLKAILEQAGFEVDAVGNFTAASERIHRDKYDAVVADIGLERKDLGLQLAREAKRQKQAPAVLVFTGDPTIEQLRAAMALPFDYVAFKPMDLEEIKSALARLIAHRRDVLSFGLSASRSQLPGEGTKF